MRKLGKSNTSIGSPDGHAELLRRMPSKKASKKKKATKKKK